MFILPNPSRTDPGVVENLLYVGTNLQVQDDDDDDDDGDDGNDEEEVDAHFHYDLVHHE